MDDRGPWLQTMDGDALYLLTPGPSAIRLSTIAIVLARLCRFGGHTKEFYSVAEHSLRVCYLVSAQTTDPHLHLAALLHDAHEAYSGFGDVCRPAKCIAPQIEHVQADLDAVIAAKYGFTPDLFHHCAVKTADAVLLATEARDLMHPPPRPWGGLPAPLPTRIAPHGIHGIHETAWEFECHARTLVHAVRQLNNSTERATHEPSRETSTEQRPKAT